jgi:hypothetical protein
MASVVQAGAGAVSSKLNMSQDQSQQNEKVSGEGIPPPPSFPEAQAPPAEEDFVVQPMTSKMRTVGGAHGESTRK